LVALLFAGLLQGDGPAPALLVAGFVLLGLARAALGHVSERMLQRSAHALVARLRDDMITTETTRASDTGFGGAGAVAVLGSTKLEMLIPYVTRYRPARMRVLLVPPVILALSFWHAWVVGLVLLVAGPLIPVFMALVGWAAKEASARQLSEIGTLNDLLVERFSALPDIRALGAGGARAGWFCSTGRRLAPPHHGRACRSLHVIHGAGIVLGPWGRAGGCFRGVFAAECCHIRNLGGTTLTGCGHVSAVAGAGFLPASARCGRRVARQGRSRCGGRRV